MKMVQIIRETKKFFCICKITNKKSRCRVRGNGFKTKNVKNKY
jgi:hypothetical protein